jgi:phage tail tube protein FII
MKAEVSLLSVNKVIYDAIKKQNKAKFVIKEVVVEDGKNVNITHTITGNFNTENDTTKTKENKKKKIKINCIQYTKEQDGSEVIFADLENNILRINGEDIMEDIRNAIM